MNYQRNIPSVLILGHGNSGKDTFATLLLNHTQNQYSFTSSSQAASTYVFEYLQKHPLYKNKYASVAECFLDRRNQRQLWYDIISNHINRDDPTFLSRKVLEMSDIYVGMRSRREYNAVKAAMLFDAVIWIDASKRGVEPESTMDIPYENSMYLIDNNQDLDFLNHQAYLMGKFLLGASDFVKAFFQKEDFLC